MHRRRLLPVPVLLLVIASLTPGLAGAQEQTGSITGTVEEQVVVVPQPLEDVCVIAFQAGHGKVAGRATTAADGTYEIAGLAPGRYYVVFNVCLEHVADYAAEWWEDAPGAEDASLVNVPAGGTTDGVDAVLEESGTMSGMVTDDGDGGALEGICVQAADFDNGMFGLARTSGDGTYAVANLRDGSYIVFFTDCSDPFTYVSHLYGFDPETDTPPEEVQVEQGSETSDIDAALVEGGMIRGVLTGAHTGSHVPDVCVVAQSESGIGPIAFSGWTKRIEDPLTPSVETPGAYILAGVEPGEHVVQFAGCEAGHRQSWWEDTQDSQSADVVSIAPGDVLDGFDAAIQPLPSIARACSFESNETDETFPDVGPGSNEHHVAIECVSDYGIAEGREDGTYGPAQPVRRDQMAAFVARTLAELEVELPQDPADAFNDDGDSTHELAINQLAALDVVQGVGGGRFAPARAVHRGQMTSFLVAAYEEATDLELRATDEWFGDDDGTTHEANIDLAASAGLTAGAAEGGFEPGRDVRRDQMATFLARLLDRAFRDALFDRFGPLGGDAPESQREATTTRSSSTEMFSCIGGWRSISTQPEAAAVCAHTIAGPGAGSSVKAPWSPVRVR